MERIEINKLGPIEQCNLEIKDFMVFTGPQASGKSTIAKSIFFFKNLKTMLWREISKKNLTDNENTALTVKQRFLKEIRSTFLQTFGSTWCMDNHMSIKYWYTDDIYVRISLRKNSELPNYIWIDMSKTLSDFLRTFDNKLIADIQETKKEIYDFFQDDMEVIYIPAGRNMMTLFSSQLMYWYSMMNDEQKRSLDYCTQSYLEKILEMKTFFSNNDIKNIIIHEMMSSKKNNIDNLLKCSYLMENILNGQYQNIDGEERLEIKNGKYVKINFASSGQQEAMWILNVIFYYLANNKKMYFIIEEPESHLFPNAQKLITEYISLAKNNGSKILLTTHSPYILGTINNLLYANKISSKVKQEKLEKIIDKKEWIAFDKFAAYYLEKGTVNTCTDEEFESINNEVIDDVSDVINEDFDKMISLKTYEN